MPLTLEQLEKSSRMDSSIAKFLNDTPLPSLPWHDPLATQKLIASTEQVTLKALGPAEAALTEYYTTIPLRDDTSIRIKIVRPTTVPTQGSPLTALLFGGGWIGGTDDQMTLYARALCRTFGAVVVNLNYRLAPQHKFPTQQLDAWDGLRWVADHAAELHADPTKGFIVGGVSAGASCAAVITRLAQEQPLAHPLTGMWLAIPSLFDPETVPKGYKDVFLSRSQNSQAPILGGAALVGLTKAVQWDVHSSLKNPTLSNAPLSGLPSTYFQVCGMDPLRDDALIYEEMLRLEGVKTRLDMYDGAPHGFWSVFRELEISRRAYADVVKGFGWLLGTVVADEDVAKAYARPEV